MFLKSLVLRNFRIYREAKFTFHEQVNLIHGDNAQGKTTLLEAIHLLMCGRSFRTPQLSDMIKHGENGFQVDAIFEKYGVEQSLRFAYDGKERQITHNNTKGKTASLLGLLLGVVMTPEDIALVKGAPAQRRQFLDLQIAQSDPLYIHHFMRYSRAMKQRNTLLRLKQLDSIESWELEMARAAAYLTKQRHHTSHALKELCAQTFCHLGRDEAGFELMYKTGAEIRDDIPKLTEYFIALYRKNRPREIVFSTTLSGPHKDDLKLSLDAQEVRHFASEGQQRTCVTAMRFAEWQQLAAVSGQPPLLLIDDVGVSLDPSRREKLFGRFNSFQQVFLTSTEQLSMPSNSIKLIEIINK